MADHRNNTDTSQLLGWLTLGLLWAALVLLFLVPGPAFLWVIAGAATLGLLRAIVWERSMRTPLAGPVLLYAGLILLSAIVNSSMLESWADVAVTIVSVAGFFAAASVLAGRARLAWWTTGVVLLAAVIGFQGLVYHTVVGFDTRPTAYPIAPQWSGYPEIGLLTVLALPFAVAMIGASRAGAATSGAALTLVLVAEILATYSRAAWLAGLVGCAGVAAYALWRLRRWPTMLALTTVAVAAAVTLTIWREPYLRALMESLVRPSGHVYQTRWQLWRQTLSMIGHAPLFGVGPGNYTTAFVAGYASDATRASALHAHNTLLHVAAESGVPAAVALAFVFWRALTRLWQAPVASGRLGVIRAGLFGALVVFVARSLFDHFMGGLPTSTRFTVVCWLLLAMASAAVTLRTESPSESVAEPPASG